ncbi:MAG: FitA-like ribbon-helix-helix domain-containing protein [Nanobdellota archaeon]
MEIKQYADYIKECRKRGFDDIAIKESLLAKNWPEEEIDNAFTYINKTKIKKELQEHEKLSEEIEEEVQEKEGDYGSSVVIFLDEELKKALEKRAKKNMFSMEEQIEDILRRSTLSMKNKKSLPEEKVDDNLIPLFSRRNTGQKKKKKKAQQKKKIGKKQKKKERKEKRVKRRAERKEKRKAKKK